MLLSVDGLTKDFGGVRALDGVSLSVKEGEITALIGPNGAGKSTMVNMISGIDRPSAGSIIFKGEHIEGLPSHERARRGIAVTFQLVRLFKNLTAVENVMVGRHVRTMAGITRAMIRDRRVRSEEEETRDYAMQLLKLVGLEKRSERLAGEFNLAQQRMIELARALATEPKLLLLDEVASGLNPAECEALEGIWRTILDRGTTLFIIEHNVSLVMRVSHRLVVLDFGKKIAEGAPEEIAENAAVIEAYLGKEIERAQA